MVTACLLSEGDSKEDPFMDLEEDENECLKRTRQFCMTTKSFTLLLSSLCSNVYVYDMYASIRSLSDSYNSYSVYSRVAFILLATLNGATFIQG